MALLQADLSQVKESTGFDPIPPGEYDVVVSDSEVKTSKSGHPMATFVLEVEGPEYAGRLLWENFLLDHEVGLSRLKALAIAAGHPNPNHINDTEELHGSRCRIKVRIKQQEGREPENQITSFKAIEGASAPGVAPQTPPASTKPQAPAGQAPASGGKPPWAR